jgi:hypothetical protein
MAILKTRMTLKQVRAEDGHIIADKDGNAFLEVGVANTYVSHLKIQNSDASQSPAIMSKSAAIATVDLALMAKGEGYVAILPDGNYAAKLKLASGASNSMQGPGLSAHATSQDFPVVFPVDLPASDAFLKIDSAGQLEFATGSASSFNLTADTGAAQLIEAGDTLNLIGTTEEVETLVSGTDQIKIGLPATVKIETALKVPAIKAADGSAAMTIDDSTGKVTFAGDVDVLGATTTVNTQDLVVQDKDIIIASGATSIAQANGAGIKVSESAYATLLFDNAASSWDSNLDWNLELGKVYKINDVEVLNANGAKFLAAGLGKGIDVDGAGLPELAIVEERAGMGSTAGGSLGGTTTIKVEVAGVASNYQNHHFQVFLNGILQKGIDEGNAAGLLASGDADYAYNYDSGNTKAVFFFADDMVSSEDSIAFFYAE